MKNTLLKMVVVASVFLMGLGVSGSAMAGGGGGHGGGGHGGGYGGGHGGYGGGHGGYGGGHGGYGYGGHGGYGYGGHGYGYYGGYGHGYGYYGGDLAFGLGFGSVLGYAVGSSRYSRNDHSHAVEVSPQTRYSRGECLQEREYQIKVVVGGKKVPAYGTACLQQDGTWLRGPVTLAKAQEAHQH